MIDTDLLAFLQQLNTAAGGRVYLESADQDESLPLIVLRRNGGEQPRVLGGRKLFERSSFEISIVTRSHAQSYPIAAAIRAALDGYRGVIGTTTVVDARCTSFPDHATEVTGDDRRRLVTSQFRFTHAEV